MSRWIVLVLTFALPVSSTGQTRPFAEDSTITEEDLSPEAADFLEPKSDIGPDYVEAQFDLWLSQQLISRKGSANDLRLRVETVSDRALRLRCALSLPPQEICLPPTAREADLFDLFPSARERVELFGCSLAPRPGDLKNCDRLFETSALKHSKDKFSGLFAHPSGLVGIERYESIVGEVAKGGRIPGHIVLKEDTTRDEELQIEMIRRDHDIQNWETDLKAYVAPSLGAIGGAGFAQWKAARVTRELTRRVALGELGQVGGFVFNPHTGFAVVRGEAETRYFARKIERSMGKDGLTVTTRKVIDQFIATPEKAFSTGQTKLIPKFTAAQIGTGDLPALHTRIKNILADGLIQRPELFARLQTHQTDAALHAARERMLQARLDLTTSATEGALPESAKRSLARIGRVVENGGRRMMLWMPERLETMLLRLKRGNRALGGRTTIGLTIILPLLAWATTEYWYSRPQNVPTFVSVAPPNQKVFTNESSYGEVASLESQWIIEMAHQFAVGLRQEGRFQQCAGTSEGCDLVYGVPSHIMANVLIPLDPLEER